MGGQRFHSRRSTLSREPDSMLAALFSGRFMVDKEEDGTIFIDRDPELFRKVLAYLRDEEGGVEVPEEEGERWALKREVEFYGLSAMKEKLEKQLWAMSEKIYVVGGMVEVGEEEEEDEYEDATDSVEIFEVVAGKWKQVHPIVFIFVANC